MGQINTYGYPLPSPSSEDSRRILLPREGGEFAEERLLQAIEFGDSLVVDQITGIRRGGAAELLEQDTKGEPMEDGIPDDSVTQTMTSRSSPPPPPRAILTTT